MLNIIGATNVTTTEVVAPVSVSLPPIQADPVVYREFTIAIIRQGDYLTGRELADVLSGAMIITQR